MKNCNGDCKVGSASDIKPKSVSDSMEQLQIIRISIRFRNDRSLFFDLKRDLRHFRDLFQFKMSVAQFYFFHFLLISALQFLFHSHVKPANWIINWTNNLLITQGGVLPKKLLAV